MTGYAYGLLLYIFRMCYLTRFSRKNFRQKVSDPNTKVSCACALAKLEKFYFTELRPELGKGPNDDDDKVVAPVSDEDGEVEENAKVQEGLSKDENGEDAKNSAKSKETRKKAFKGAPAITKNAPKSPKHKNVDEKKEENEEKMTDNKEEDQKVSFAEDPKAKKKKRAGLAKNEAILPAFRRHKRRRNT